jgi:hypothetical protein
MHMTARHGPVIGIFMLLLASCSYEPEETTSPQVTDAWIRKPIPPLDKTAGYFRITNRSGEKIVLTGASSSVAHAIEFHETLKVDDMMRMRRVKEIELGPGETLSFAPGGKHLMIFGFKAITSPVYIELRFAAGQTLEVPFEMR